MDIFFETNFIEAYAAGLKPIGGEELSDAPTAAKTAAK
jgi:hypothetical protein